MSNNPDRIANILNEHFASVGPKLANKLPSVQHNYFEFLNRSYSPATSFAFNLVTPSEVKLEISRLSFSCLLMTRILYMLTKILGHWN